jgi:cobaltochelatase CobT
MGEVQALARRQQRIEELCAASIRALCGQRDLHFRGRRLHRGRTPLPLFAPHLHPRVEGDDEASFRGAADGLALRLARSDAALHRSLAPVGPLQRLLFDTLEQFRTEALADPAMPGVARNLAHRFEQWALGFHGAGLTDSDRGLLLYTVIQVCRARVLGVPVTAATEDLLETTRGALVPRIGHALAGLRRERTDQAAYAQHALAIARSVARMAGPGAADGAHRDGLAQDAEANERAAFALVMDSGPEVPEALPGIVGGRSGVLEGSAEGYRVYTRAYDREVAAARLVRAAELRALRETLDARIAAAGFNLPRLARELHALLAVPVRDGWDDAQEEGRIDGRRLAQLVSSPTERRLFRSEREPPCADALVSVLVDCSGSMKQHIEPVAVLVDTLVRALEAAGVATELLGHGTGAWNGGRAQRDWQRAGRPPHPGRLNELLWMVFKSADTPWRRARPGIAALLKPELFREGADGEAVDWAIRRMEGRTEARRILLVVSDGCPMDTATNLANDEHYLDNHLGEVVARHEQRGRVEILGLGVGLDLSRYYSRCQALDLSAPPGNTVWRELLGLLAGRGRR